MSRSKHNARRFYYPGTCEHCDRGIIPVRFDPMRGNVCRTCDNTLDAMLDEKRSSRVVRRP